MLHVIGKMKNSSPINIEMIATHPRYDVEAEQRVLYTGNIPGEPSCTFTTRIRFCNHYNCVLNPLVAGFNLDVRLNKRRFKSNTLRFNAFRTGAIDDCTLTK